MFANPALNRDAHGVHMIHHHTYTHLMPPNLPNPTTNNVLRSTLDAQLSMLQLTLSSESLHCRSNAVRYRNIRHLHATIQLVNDAMTHVSRNFSPFQMVDTLARMCQQIECEIHELYDIIQLWNTSGMYEFIEIHQNIGEQVKNCL